jgi:hypothetical protein
MPRRQPSPERDNRRACGRHLCRHIVKAPANAAFAPAKPYATSVRCRRRSQRAQNHKQIVLTADSNGAGSGYSPAILDDKPRFIGSPSYPLRCGPDGSTAGNAPR